MKKLVMRIFPKYFTVVKLINIDSIEKSRDKYTLSILNPQAESINDCLGISEERCNQLYSTIYQALNVTNSVVDVISTVNSQCLHINEVAWSIYQIRGILEGQKKMSVIMDMLEGK